MDERGNRRATGACASRAAIASVAAFPSFFTASQLIGAGLFAITFLANLHGFALRIAHYAIALLAI